MSYQEMDAVYTNSETKSRGVMCIKEQGYIYVNDTRHDIAALGAGVVRGLWTDIDAVWTAVATGPNYATIGDDQALLSAVQSVWPSVAAILYPAEVAPQEG